MKPEKGLNAVQLPKRLMTIAKYIAIILITRGGVQEMRIPSNELLELFGST